MVFLCLFTVMWTEERARRGWQAMMLRASCEHLEVLDEMGRWLHAEDLDHGLTLVD